MIMARYLDPKDNLTFKRIFGEHPDLPERFLNAAAILDDTFDEEKNQEILRSNATYE
jgi:hypothetical protein